MIRNVDIFKLCDTSKPTIIIKRQSIGLQAAKFIQHACGCVYCLSLYGCWANLPAGLLSSFYM